MGSVSKGKMGVDGHYRICRAGAGGEEEGGNVGERAGEELPAGHLTEWGVEGAESSVGELGDGKVIDLEDLTLPSNKTIMKKFWFCLKLI